MNARDLSNRLAELLRNERQALADFLVALADFDQQRLWRHLGHASLFNFLRRELGLSTGSAFYRKTAAEIVQKFPEVIQPLREGKLCLTTVVELSKVLTRENLREVLPRFFNASKQAAKEVAVEIRPEAAPQRMVVTAVRGPAARTLALTMPAAAQSSATEFHPFRPDETRACQLDAPTQEGSLLSVTPPFAAPRMAVEPKTAEQSRVHVTVSREFLRKLSAARDALSHSHPGASEAEILEAGLDLLLERSAKRRGLVAKPRKEPPARRAAPSGKPDRFVAAHVRREVWRRDQGRCQWPLEGGGVCSSTCRVEIDHVIAVAKGGGATAKDLRLLCRPHNDLAARHAFGDVWMDRYTGA
jgi:hypothetical protein